MWFSFHVCGSYLMALRRHVPSRRPPPSVAARLAQNAPMSRDAVSQNDNGIDHDVLPALSRTFGPLAELIGTGNKGSDCYFARREPEWLICLLTFSGDEHVPKSSKTTEGRRCSRSPRARAGPDLRGSDTASKSRPRGRWTFGAGLADMRPHFWPIARRAPWCHLEPQSRPASEKHRTAL